MKEIRIEVPTPDEFFSEGFGKHLLRAHKEFLLALATIPHGIVNKIGELENRIEEGKKE